MLPEGNTVMMKKAVIGTIRQPINLLSASTGVVEIGYEDGDELIHYVDDDGQVLHNPNYPDPECPCYGDDEQGDTTSDYALALTSYCSDFYSIAPAGFNTGGPCLERHVAARVLRGVA